MSPAVGSVCPPDGLVSARDRNRWVGALARDRGARYMGHKSRESQQGAAVGSQCAIGIMPNEAGGGTRAASARPRRTSEALTADGTPPVPLGVVTPITLQDGAIAPAARTGRPRCGCRRWTRWRQWVGRRVWATAAWMAPAAGLYWLAVLVPNFAVFALTTEIADRPGGGPYTTKALMSIARAAAMPLGFATTLITPVRRRITTGWWRPMGLVAFALVFSTMPNLFFAIDDISVRVVSRFVGSFFFSWAFCVYIGYAQGRRASDALMPAATACMLASSAISRAISPLVKNDLLGGSMGGDDDDNDRAYRWMPAVVSALALGPMLVAAAALAASPRATEADAAARVRRTGGTLSTDLAWLRRHWAPLLGLAVNNTVLQAVRGVRDVFATDLLGADAPWWHWVVADVPTCLGVCLLYAPFVLVKGNRRAFMAVNVLGLVAGVLMILGGVLGLVDAVPPLPFLVVSGLGYYLAVVPFAGGGVIIERLVASSGRPVDAMLLNVVCQLPGYTGALVVLLLVPAAADVKAYFDWTTLAGGGVMLVAYAWTLGAAWFVLPADGARQVRDSCEMVSMAPASAPVTLSTAPPCGDNADGVADDTEGGSLGSV
ncbi:hypothetical protein psal_cds_878 [Pandoravirus salinus]|uniref:Uncharacterized protein n=1 Tax=Pandoravirus salinus TaxID=1349410 RepID=S4W311_9VIRU|nr:hypothetical protein psal_cds_878 [Pandoravirus salinus]AGO84952.2 hypothetical protein psal_cds_878 [Pandoravirus salinus]